MIFVWSPIWYTSSIQDRADRAFSLWRKLITKSFSLLLHVAFDFRLRPCFIQSDIENFVEAGAGLTTFILERNTRATRRSRKRRKIIQAYGIRSRSRSW